MCQKLSRNNYTKDINVIYPRFKQFTERTNTLLYKNMYLSPFILDVVCERWVETGTDCYIDQLLLQTIAALLSHLGWGCSTEGHLGPQSSVCKLALSVTFLSSTNSTAAGSCLYSFMTSTCFRFFYTGASLDWRLDQGSIYNPYFSKCTPVDIFLTSLSIPLTHTSYK